MTTPLSEEQQTCPQVGDVIHCGCGKPSSHYGTMGYRGAREVRETPPKSSNPLLSPAELVFQLAQLEAVLEIRVGDIPAAQIIRAATRLIGKLTSEVADETTPAPGSPGELLGCKCIMCEFHRSAEAMERQRLAVNWKGDAG